jgi:hypothetical protein
MNMESSLVKIFTGTEVNVIMLKGLLEEIGVSAMTRNEFQSSIIAGYGTGVPSAVDLFIQESDQQKAVSIIKEFIERDK